MNEQQNIEWKESWRDEYLRWVCGFANAEGGTLIIGKDDRGRVVGAANAAKLLVDLPNKIRDVLGVIADVRLTRESGKEVIEIHVDPYPSPISYKGEYHYRSGSTKQELKGAALDRFLLKKHGWTWDRVPIPAVRVEDLSPAAFREFRRLAKGGDRVVPGMLDLADDDLLDKLNLVEGEYLRRAAVLLFHPEPNRYFTGSFVKIGFFASAAEVLYHDEIHGDLFSQSEKVLDVLTTKYLRAVISYEGKHGLHRFETLPAC